MPSTPISVFDPAVQQEDPDAKIIAVLQRLGESLRGLLWERAGGAWEGGSLSPAQAQALVFLLFHEEKLARVGELAREFAMTSATMSDAVSSLERKGLVAKQRLARDHRQVVLRLTPEGERVARGFADWAAPVESVLAPMPGDDKEVVLQVLIELLARLREKGIVHTGRMCPTCRYFDRERRPNAREPYFCLLLDRPLAVRDLRLDCPEHEPTE